jgi:hypothetical protein
VTGSARDWQNEWPVERVAAAAGAVTARYLDSRQEVRVVSTSGRAPLTARTIIEVAGTFLVETVDEPDDWYLGERAPDGAIVCWGRYGDIEAALRSL